MGKMKFNLASLEVIKIWSLSSAVFVFQEHFSILNLHFVTVLGGFENSFRDLFGMIFLFPFHLSRCSQNDVILPNNSKSAPDGALSSLLWYFQNWQFYFISELQIAAFLHFLDFFLGPKTSEMTISFYN